MLTFLLAGLGVVLMHHCHNNLLGTELKLRRGSPGFRRPAGRVSLRRRQRKQHAALRDRAHALRSRRRSRRSRARRGRDLADHRAYAKARLGAARPLRRRHAPSRRPVPRVDLGAHGLPLPRLSAARAPGPPPAREHGHGARREAGSRRLRFCGPARGRARRPATAHRVEGVRAHRHAVAEAVRGRRSRAVHARLGRATGRRRRDATVAARALVPRRGRRIAQLRAPPSGHGAAARHGPAAPRRVPRARSPCSRQPRQ